MSIFIVNCEWSDWSKGDCSKICGGGIRTNKRHKITEEEHGGSCSSTSEFEEICNNVTCPSNNDIVDQSFLV